MSWKAGESGSNPSEGAYVPLYRPAHSFYRAHAFLFNGYRDVIAQGNFIRVCSKPFKPISDQIWDLLELYIQIPILYYLNTRNF